MEYIKLKQKEMEELKKQLIPWFGDGIMLDSAFDIMTEDYYLIVSGEGHCINNKYDKAYQEANFTAEDVFEKVGEELKDVKVKPRNKKEEKIKRTENELIKTNELLSQINRKFCCNLMNMLYDYNEEKYNLFTKDLGYRFCEEENDDTNEGKIMRYNKIADEEEFKENLREFLNMFKENYEKRLEKLKEE